ncbi:glutamate--cysteine ligase [Herbaspirillum sp. RTI4]|uniref:glutamate--cysteine ligase n=1 Tax=Herbaspirillum sp. RTI4 TaxID=3048640 RepID=UPI002AB45B00|nr:glutamate--cysteine ligase [Herbaspirillum sp. RTI4]MDY7577995.1 glutamate--cysteine ligase [Herbaspirillum sp. RTI4]MEA9982075.1 glutamate--cysteine ligase [Herbaspirillum sp. RTI4]
MTDLLNHRLALFAQPQQRALLAHGLRGIERETLRVTDAGELAATPHPVALGSALMHQQITTDYSESLLEFITPPVADIAQALERLDQIHRYAYSHLGDELLWNQSMPCHLPPEADIPLAWFGNSHIGMLKHVYRRGLALRYGKTMQCIAGIHYNFSFDERVWEILRQEEGSALSAKDFQSESYIALIRNFRRYSWLLMYLFGASPAVSANFLRGQTHQLEQLDDDTLFLPYATSLRMSDLGYRNSAQAGLTPHYNTLESYISSLAKAVSQPYPAYEAIGTERDGEWLQINTNVLQIENEYYSTIRPKRVINSGERPIQALSARGVQYVEVRCMDIDPFDPLGISLQTTRFLNVFLHFLAFVESPLTSEAEGDENKENFNRTVKEGRRPGLALQRRGQPVGLQAWGLEMLDAMQPVAQLLDAEHGGDEHSQALEVQRAKLLNVELTPSARMLSLLREEKKSFIDLALQQNRADAAYFRARPLSAEQIAEFDALAATSLEEQAQIEATQTGDFGTFVAAYRASTLGNFSI